MDHETTGDSAHSEGLHGASSTHSYRTTGNWVGFGFFCLILAFGLLLLLLAPGPGGLACGAMFGLPGLIGAVYSYLAIKNKSITLTGDRIQVVTVSGRTLDYRADQITSYRYDDTRNTFSPRNSVNFGVLVFDDRVRFSFGDGISNFFGLIDSLSEMAPPDTIKRPNLFETTGNREQ